MPCGPAYIWYCAPDSAPPGSMGLCSSALGDVLCSRNATVVAAAASPYTKTHTLGLLDVGLAA